MQLDTKTTTATYLIWGRDASHGGFAYPFTSQLDSLANLPLAAERLLGTPISFAAREHLAQLAAQLPESCSQIHLPFLERQELDHVSEILLKTSLMEDAPSVYRVARADQLMEAEFFRQCLILVAPALFPTPGVPITAAFNLERTALAGSFLPWIPEAVAVADPQEQFHAKMTVAYTESDERGWSQICPERSKDYLPRYGRMSIAMRRALRYWVPMIYLTKPVHFQDSDWTWPMLGWASTRPLRARSSRDFSYDVLDAESMDKAGKSMRRNLRTYLGPIHDSLNAIGEPMMAAHYSPNRHVNGALTAEYHVRHFNALFAGEQYLVEILLSFGMKLAALRSDREQNHSRKVRSFHRIVREFSKSFSTRLRRFFGTGDWEKLAPVLLLELTNSLAGSRQPLPLMANGILVKSAYDEEMDLAA